MDDDDDCCYCCVLIYDECVYLNERRHPKRPDPLPEDSKKVVVAFNDTKTTVDAPVVVQVEKRPLT